MKKMHQKLNVYFFGEVDAAAADQVMYYGTFATAAGLLGIMWML